MDLLAQAVRLDEAFVDLDEAPVLAVGAQEVQGLLQLESLGRCARLRQWLIPRVPPSLELLFNYPGLFVMRWAD